MLDLGHPSDDPPPREASAWPLTLPLAGAAAFVTVASLTAAWALTLWWTR